MIVHTFADQLLIRQFHLQQRLGMTRSGLDKLRKKDPTFPKPLKDGDARQTATFYVVAEVEEWLKAKIAARDCAIGHIGEGV